MTNGIKQESHGDQSPNIQAGGDVKVSYISSHKGAFAVLGGLALVAIGIAIVLAYLLGTTKPTGEVNPEGEAKMGAVVDASGAGPFEFERKLAESIELVKKLQVQTWDYDYGKTPAGEPMLRKALEDGELEIARKVVSDAMTSRESRDNPSKRAAEEFVLGGIHYIEGELDDARIYYEKAVGRAPGNRTFHTELGNVLRVQAEDDIGQMAPAIEQYRLALGVSLDSIRGKHGELAGGLGKLMDGWEDFDSEEKAGYRRDLGGMLDRLAGEWDGLGKRPKAKLGADLRDMAEILNHLGTAAYQVYEYEQATDYYWIALNMRLVMLGEARSHIAGLLEQLTNRWSELDDNARRSLNGALRSGFNALVAEQDARDAEAKAEFEDRLGDVAASLNNLGVVQDDEGNYEKAINYYRGALRISRKILGERHRNVASIYNNIGVSRFELNEFAEAESAYGDALAIRRAVLEPGHPQIGEVLNNLGRLWFADANYRKAESCFKQSYKIFGESKALGPGHPRTEDADYWLTQSMQRVSETGLPEPPCEPEG